MYECPNCSAGLKYHISKHTLYCDSCETTVSPYLFQKEHDAEEHTEYEVTVFTCPQCGGDILSEDTTAATFCSYCGSSTILDSRISKEKRPKYIIPFSKTEAGCKTAYRKMMKQAFFAPDELKDEEHIKKFRGIYMPYWVYSFEKKGPISFTGSTSRRSGDYIVTTHYKLNCDVDAEYDGIAFDASSSFSDNLSNAIAPFNIKKGKPFTPAFLSGFYADTSDVDQSLYVLDAEQLAIDIQCEQFIRKSVFKKYDLDEPQNLSSLKYSLTPDSASADLALFPVWFLSYRKNDRVAYAVVNGQTGKAVADLPVDIKKYLLGSLMLTVPLFILLNLFFTLKPNWLLIIVAILTLICTMISNVQISRIIRRENSEDDRGLQYIKWNTPEAASLPLSSMMDYTPETNEQSSGSSGKSTPVQRQRIQPAKKKKTIVKANYLQRNASRILFISLVLLYYYGKHFGLHPLLSIFIFMLVLLLSGIINNLSKSPMDNTLSPDVSFYFTGWKEKLPLLIKPLSGLLAALTILIINPVSDIIYYLGAICCMCMMVWVVIDIIKQHNTLSTRKLPQLNKRGGDEVA